MGALDQQLARLAAFWRGLTSAQRIAALAIVLLVGGAVTLIANFATRTEWATLYSELEADDARKILDKLDALRVEHKLENAGTSISVPLERVYDLRLDLASEGLPSAGPVGFETFDDVGLGLTPFQEKVRYRRALEGELARTIGKLGHVRWARVHLNLPEKAVFQRDKKPASAAVVVNLAQGRMLTQAEVAGIGHLVASSVEGLQVNQVSVLDTAGRLLARSGGGEDGDSLAVEALGVQRSIEKELGERAQRLLDAALGAGRSVVTVSAAVDRRKIEENQERVNPTESAVISEQTTEESRSEPAGLAAGVPGTPSNTPEGGGEEGSTGAVPPATESVTRATTNFEVSRTKSHTVVPLGKLERLSVAVIVDDAIAPPAPLAEGEEAPETPPPTAYRSRTPEEVAAITEIVKRAVGFETERGDVIEVRNMPFRNPLEDVGAESLPFWRNPEVLMLVSPIARALGLIGGLALLAFAVLRPALAQLANAQVVSPARLGGEGVVAPGAGGALAAKLQADDVSIPITKENAKAVAEAMKQWLRE